VAAQLVASQEGLSSVSKYVSKTKLAKFDALFWIKYPGGKLSTSSTTRNIFIDRSANRAGPPTAACISRQLQASGLGSALNPPSGLAVSWQHMQFLMST
jgi:hypothetical protein